MAKKDQRIVNRQAPQCDEETYRRRRMGAEKIVGQRSGRTKRSVEAATKKKAWEKHRLYHGGPTSSKDKLEMAKMFFVASSELEVNWRNSHLSVRRWRKDKGERVESGEDGEMLSSDSPV